MKTHFDTVKNAWQRFAAQPGNTHIALAAALLLGLVLVVTLADGGESEQLTDSTSQTESESAAAPDDTPVVTDLTEPVIAEAESAGPVIDETDAVAVDAPALVGNRLVIILDDIGNNAAAGERAVNLPGAVTYAVLPFTPHGQTLANMAHEAGKEVMLHAPMSNLAGMALGEGGLTLTLTEEEFINTLRAAIADIPHIAGVNNHTGSELTAAVQPMQWVMRELKQQGLFFVDSMTTGNSVAGETAIELQVPSLKRHVFLDNEATPEAIDREFQRALDIARQQGFAVAIGHPYPATLDYLEQALLTLPEHDITLVSASALLEREQQP
ncbi:MAG: divergent polysaccharide deacetylase family protein [Pseudohongiella sp.]